MMPTAPPSQADQHIAWIALSLIEHLGAATLRALAAHFNGDLCAAIAADTDELRRVRGIGPKLSAAIRAIDLEAVKSALAAWRAAGVIPIPLDAPDFPPALRRIDSPPPVLFVQGSPAALNGHAYAVVGTRHPSALALDIAIQLGFALANAGVTVVSGLALGVDVAAHHGALSAPRGVTVAVLGSGLLNIYPPSHRVLAAAIAARGALISELHPHAEPKPQNLVARNRLISGLCAGVIIVETGVEGGAMYAARRAWEQGRAVYVVNCDASGNRALIADGAIPLSTDLSDIDRLFS